MVDGPPRKIDGVKIGRRPLSDHLDLFNTDVTIVVDDADRGREMKLLRDMKEKLGREYIVNKGKDHRGKSTLFAIFDRKSQGLLHFSHLVNHYELFELLQTFSQEQVYQNLR